MKYINRVNISRAGYDRYKRSLKHSRVTRERAPIRTDTAFRSKAAGGTALDIDRVTGAEEAYSAHLISEEPEVSETVHHMTDPRVQEALGHLCETDRKTIEDYYIRGLSQRQMAEAQGMHQGSISYRIKTAQWRLAHWLKSPEEPPFDLLAKWLGKPAAEVAIEFGKHRNQMITSEEISKLWGSPTNQPSIRVYVIGSIMRLAAWLGHKNRPKSELEEIRKIKAWMTYAYDKGAFVTVRVKRGPRAMSIKRKVAPPE